ncbi:hypothetical protein S225a_25200 [Candidatus Brocadiaceae bacterium S225]|uniref:Uncharacterized protein n=1 Tax=Candidatus Scalindua brodae TaxID=237368 RepID=A0A0B0EKK1_9BACT|nr:MAG: hypothetical protein SCABRO_01695 [Candidatus Scalindua brodae]TWU30653.1 hypothetical protein S225a_25200 [Candidatus Brocadiaceae bacterium S225]
MKHAKHIDRQLARLLRMSGFRTIRLGFEGTSAALQKASGNKVSRRELETAMYHLREAEVDSGVVYDHNDYAWDIGIYLLIGMPGQTVDEVVESIEYIHG